MKIKQIILFIILFASFIIFASMKPENTLNNHQNFGINDTIDSLKNMTNTPISFDDLGLQQDLDSVNQELDNANQELDNKRQELQQKLQELQQKIAQLETLQQITQSKQVELNELVKERVALQVEAETLGGQIDSNEILEGLKTIATSTSIDEVWNDYKDWLISKGYTKQDLVQN